MADIMLWLSSNTIICLPILIVLILGIYLALSIMIYIKTQNKGYDVGGVCFIPIWHFIYLLRKPKKF